MPSLWPVYVDGCSSIHTMPSAATSDGSQSEWSASGMLKTNPSDATGTSIRNVLTVMSNGRSWCAAETVRCSSAAFAIPYAMRSGMKFKPATDDTLTIAPLPFAFIAGMAARIAMSGARRSTCITRSKRFICMSRSPGNVIAALLTSASTRPKCSIVVATIRSTSSSRARFVGTAIASPPAAVMRRTVSSMVPGMGSGEESVARAAQATLHPRWASSSAVAAPTPRDAPVTMATLPERSMRPTIMGPDPVGSA